MKNLSCLALSLALALSGGAINSAAWAQIEHAADIEKLKTYHFGNDEAPLNAVVGWVNQVRPDAARRAEAARALATVLSTDASFDAKQFVCRQLAQIAGEEQIPALAGLLGDENLAHYALMALAHIPGPAVNEALRNALPNSKGRPQLEIITVLGERRDGEAIAPLAALLPAADDALVATTADALGKIGDARSVAPLRTAYQAATGARKVAVARGLLVGADRLREAGDGKTALPLYQLLQGEAPSPLVGAAALRGLVLIQGEGALPQVLTALAQDGTPQQKTAAALARDITGRDVTERLGKALPQLSPTGQLLLVAALGQRHDAGAAPAVAALLNSPEAAVRMAAADAIGIIGDATTVPLLLTNASNGPAEQRETARAGLIRLKGGAIDSKLLTLLDKAVPAQRVEIIGALRERRVVAAVAPLLTEARSPQSEVRAAALAALRELAEPDDLPKLLALLNGTTAEQHPAILNTAVEVARRGSDDKQKTAPILARLAASKTVPDKVEMLGLLGRVGGAGALETLRQSTRDTSPEIRLAALRALAAWPGDEPMEELLRIARESQDDKTRLMALRGHLRMIGVSATRSPGETLALYQQAGGIDRSDDTIKAIISGLSKLKTLESLNYASSFLKNDAARTEAELAMVDIAHGTLGPWREQTKAALEPIAKNSTNENARKGAQEILALSDKLGDYVTAWEVSPIYERAGANCTQLFDIAFAPEAAITATAAEPAVAWRVMPVATSAEQPWLLDLLALWGGEQRVAYLRTSVWSDKERDLILETGSDDGTKAWWNGKIVLSQNVQRAVEPGQDKTKLTARAGWNDLMLKITQNNQGWGTVARFTNPDGAPATGLRFALPSLRDKEPGK